MRLQRVDREAWIAVCQRLGWVRALAADRPFRHNTTTNAAAAAEGSSKLLSTSNMCVLPLPIAATQRAWQADIDVASSRIDWDGNQEAAVLAPSSGAGPLARLAAVRAALSSGVDEVSVDPSAQRAAALAPWLGRQRRGRQRRSTQSTAPGACPSSVGRHVVFMDGDGGLGGAHGESAPGVLEQGSRSDQ